jgi:hypothetical protein
MCLFHDITPFATGPQSVPPNRHHSAEIRLHFTKRGIHDNLGYFSQLFGFSLELLLVFCAVNPAIPFTIAQHRFGKCSNCARRENVTE